MNTNIHANNAEEKHSMEKCFQKPSLWWNCYHLLKNKCFTLFMAMQKKQNKTKQKNEIVFFISIYDYLRVWMLNWIKISLIMI